MAKGKEGAIHIGLKFVKNTLYIPYIFDWKNPIFLYRFGQKWLDTLLLESDCLSIRL